MKLKTLIVCLLGLSMSATCSAQAKTAIHLTGVWEAKDEQGLTGSLNFIDSANIIVTIPGQTLPPGTYTIDTSKDPMWFDVLIKNGSKSATLQSLLKLVDATTLKWQIFPDRNRPAAFVKDTGDNTIVLKKKG